MGHGSPSTDGRSPAAVHATILYDTLPGYLKLPIVMVDACSSHAVGFAREKHALIMICCGSRGGAVLDAVYGWYRLGSS